MVGLRWGTTSLGAPTPCGSPCAASKEAFQQLSAEEHNKSTTRAQHVSDRTDQTEQGFTIRSKPDPSTRRATSGFIGTMHHAHHRCKRSAGHFPVWHCFCPRELPPSTPAVGYFLVFAAIDTAKGSSSTITAQFSSTGQSIRHQAQKTHGIAGKKTHICKRQKQSCLFYVSAT